MLEVTIDENQYRNVRIREGEKNGRRWRMASQKVWLFKPNAIYPEQFEIQLPDGSTGYAPGCYVIDIESLVTRGQFDSLSLDTRNGVLLTRQVREELKPEAPQTTNDESKGSSGVKPLFKSNQTAA